MLTVHACIGIDPAIKRTIDCEPSIAGELSNEQTIDRLIDRSLERASERAIESARERSTDRAIDRTAQSLTGHDVDFRSSFDTLTSALAFFQDLLFVT